APPAGCSSTFHRIQQHDVRAVAQRCFAASQLAVHGDRHLRTRLDTDGGEQVGCGGAFRNAVTLGALGAAGPETAKIGGESDRDPDGTNIRASRVAGPAHGRLGESIPHGHGAFRSGFSFRTVVAGVGNSSGSMGISTTAGLPERRAAVIASPTWSGCST